MARSVNVNFRMDSDLKKNMESLYGYGTFNDSSFHYLR